VYYIINSLNQNLSHENRVDQKINTYCVAVYSADCIDLLTLLNQTD